MSEFIIRARDLTKKYGTFCALNNLNIDLPKGRVIGLLGPNGSGKTTFMKMLAGLLTKTSGELFIDDHPVGVETKSVVSFLPERTYFPSSMKVKECVAFFKDFYADFDEETASRMLESLGVKKDAKLRTLSKGTKEKVQLVMVMARRAKLYLLDEPIGGVDPAARDYILNTIIGNYNTEATVLISTHLITDIEPVLDDFLFLREGNVVLSGNADEVREREGKSLDELFREVFRCF